MDPNATVHRKEQQHNFPFAGINSAMYARLSQDTWHTQKSFYTCSLLHLNVFLYLADSYYLYYLFFVLFCLVFLPSNQQLLKFSQPSTLHVQAYRVCMVLFYFSAFHMLARSRHSACIRSLQRSCAFSHKLVLAVQVWTQEDVLVQENTQAHTSVY